MRTRRGRIPRRRAIAGTARGWAGDWIAHRRVQQLEDALGGGHGRLHDVVLFAQILNGAEESHAVLEEGHHHADLDGAAAHAESAVGQQQRQSQHAEKFGDGIKPAVGDDGVLVGVHVIAIDLLEFGAAARFAIEELQHGDAADVFLQIRIDARDGDRECGDSFSARRGGTAW